MSRVLDPVVYPRLSAYVGALPRGLDSYPDCVSKTSLYRTLLDGMPAPLPDPAELPPLAARLLSPAPTSIWIPEVQVMATSLLIADHFEMTDEQHREWLKNQNKSFFRSMVFRALMALISPAALVPRAGARWAAVHKGSQLSGRILSPGEAEFLLTFPAHLFAPTLLRSFTAVFEAAFEHCNARSCRVSLVDTVTTRAVFAIDWN